MDVDSKTEALRVGGGATLLTVWGITLNDWVAVCTLVYLGFQIIILAPRAIEIVKRFQCYLKDKFN